MTQKRSISTITVLSLALMAELTIGLSLGPTSALAQFVPPNRGAPRSTAGGATRSGTCKPNTEEAKRDKSVLTALVPPGKLGKFGMTTEGRPSFFVYLPPTTAQAAEFTLKDADEKDIYRTIIPLTGQTGVVSFKLPADAPELEVGKDYLWFFNVICSKEDRLRDDFVAAWIYRAEPNNTLTTALKSAAPRQRPSIFAQAGIWQDSLAALTDLRRTNPGDPTLADEWSKLLKSAGLGQITGGPPAAQLSLGTTRPKQLQ